MNEHSQDTEAFLVPVRILHDWSFCPRSAYLQWMHAEWEENQFTIEGSTVHRRVDKPGPELPPPEQAEELSLDVRSLWLSSEREGFTGRIDLLELDDGACRVVETKRGEVVYAADGAHEAERVQLAAHVMLLREHGYRCDEAELYFAASRRRVPIAIDEALLARTREIVQQLKEAVLTKTLPAPLEDSPKCRGCSLVGICLPDETTVLSKAVEGKLHRPRQLLAPHEEGLPLAVTTQGAKLRKRQGELEVWSDGAKLGSARLRETSEVLLFGGVEVSTPALQALMGEDVPVFFFSQGAWFYGSALGHGHKNVHLRVAQFAAAADEERSLRIARAIVRSKIRNQRTVLRRNHEEPPSSALTEMSRQADAAKEASSLSTLLGIEGTAARHYFQNFGSLLKDDRGFRFEHRNRRPPRDPVNAALSFCYAMLVKDAFNALLQAGFDPYLGFYHQARYGRPALALDLMEEFRPLVADSVVLMAFNNGELNARSFETNAMGCSLGRYGKRDLIRCYERRMEQELTHPIFGYSVSWRRMLKVQARLLGRHVLGEIPDYVPIETR